jgi:hypothetical protein
MSRMQSLMRAGLLAGSVATTPAAAQVAGQDQGGSPPATVTQPPASAQAPAPERGQRMIERFQAANTTGDGRLTLAQAQAGNLPMIVRHFDAIDAQHKGYVTLDDIRAYQQQMRATRAGGDGTSN